MGQLKHDYTGIVESPSWVGQHNYDGIVEPQEDDPPDEKVSFVVNKYGGGFDRYGVDASDIRPGETPLTASRRMDLGRTMITARDPENFDKGPAMFRPVGDDRPLNALDTGYKFTPSLKPMYDHASNNMQKHSYDGIIEAQPKHNYDGIVEAKHNYEGIVELPHASVKFNEDFDSSQEPSAPVPDDYKPIEFTPSDMISEASTLQRVAEGFRQLGSNDRPVRSTSPDLIGRQITLTLPDKGRKPSRDEVTSAYFDALGASAVNNRYKAETGRDIESPDVSDEDLEMGYDPQAKTYTVKVAPTKAAVAVINAYGSGGLPAAQNVLKDMQRADDEAAAKEARARDAERDVIRRLGYDPDELDGNPVARGLSRAGLSATRLINNVSALGRNPADAANDAQFINQAATSIPKSKSAAGRIVEDVVQAGASLPLYTAAGPYGAGLMGFTQNLDRGTEQAAKEGLKLSAAGGIAHGAGIAFENLSPLARQVAARHLAGMTNIGLDKLSGSDRNALGSYLSAFVLPVGAKGKPEETGPTFDYTHETLGNLKRASDQSGIGKGWVRVMTDDGEVGVVRAPNPEGAGGVRNQDGSLPRATRRTGEKILDAVNIPRATQTAFDMSAIGRQGLMLSVLHPVKAAKAFTTSIKALASEETANKVLNDIHSSPIAPLRRESGLYLSDYRHEGSPLTRGEEGFQSSAAQNLPLIGRGIRASERAYSVFLDRMRADVFDSYVKSHPDASMATMKGIASFVNKATGRGGLGAWGEKHAQALSQIFYSPRYTLSKVQLLAEPFRGTKEARLYAARNLVQYVGSGIAFMGLAKAAGLDVGTDPLSSSFGKIKVGNTQVDLWGGSSQLARYTAQLITGKATTQEGATRPRSRLQTAINFLRTRAAPQVTVPLDTALGSDAAGQPANLSNLPRRTFMPLAWRDVEDAVRDDLKQGGSGVKGAAVGSLSLLGVGANTITPKATDGQLNDYVERMKTSPENQSLSDNQLRHNAKVNLEMNRLLDSVPDAQKESARRFLNERFYYARVRGASDHRALPAIERVFNGRLVNVENDMKRKGLMK